MCATLACFAMLNAILPCLMFVCAFRGDRVRKAVCVSVRVYARGDVSVCAFGGDRMRKVCLGACVRGSERDSKES